MSGQLRSMEEGQRGDSSGSNDPPGGNEGAEQRSGLAVICEPKGLCTIISTMVVLSMCTRTIAMHDSVPQPYHIGNQTLLAVGSQLAQHCKVGDTVIALWRGNGHYYRAKITEIDDSEMPGYAIIDWESRLRGTYGCGCQEALVCYTKATGAAGRCYVPTGELNQDGAPLGKPML
jgi:hypothetical protein